MRIKNLNIGSFGKLNDVSIGLDDKITVIHGKNEAGKSSIATFIKYMLYGFDSSKKSDVSENQKKKYMPWDGEECSGQLEFEAADGKKYVAVRKTASRSQNTVFDETDMPLTSDNAGDYFFGISESAYKKTAFIGQRDASFTDDGELDSAIRNMVYSADESVDSQKALKKLEDIRKHYLGKAGRSGEIYETEKLLSDLIAERDKWKDGHKELLGAEYQLTEIRKKIEFNKEKKALLEREKENLEYLEAKNTLSKIDTAKLKAEKSKEEFEEHYKSMQNGSFVPDEEFAQSIKNCTVKISEQKNKVNECTANVIKAKENLDGVCSEDAQRRIADTLVQENLTAEALVERLKVLKKSRKSAKTLAIILTCLIITIPVAIFFYIKSSRLSKEIAQICEKYGCEDADELERRLLRGESHKAVFETARRHFEQAENELLHNKQLLEEYENELAQLSQKGGFDVNETQEYLKKLTFLLSKNDALKIKCREDFVAYTTLASSVNMDELCEKAQKYDEGIPVRDIKTVNQQLNFYTQANDALTVKERELEKTAAVLSGTLPKPSELQSRILSLSEMKNEMTAKHTALCLAIESLEKASKNMRSEASPKIASETSKLFSRISDGKYKALYTDNEMKLTFLEGDEAQIRDAGYLSAGTLDAAYISLRIALCKFLYKEHPTLIFDDAFSNMDDVRLENMLEFLTELSEEFQIVILSCHDREMKSLEGKAKIINFEIKKTCFLHGSD